MGVKYVLLCARNVTSHHKNAEDRSLSLRVLGFVNFLLSSATFIFSLCGFIFIYPVWVVWTCVLYFCVGLNGVGVILFLSLIRVDGVYILFFLFSFSSFLSSSWFSLGLKYLTVMGSSSVSLQFRSSFFFPRSGSRLVVLCIMRSHTKYVSAPRPPLPALSSYLLVPLLDVRPTSLCFWIGGASSAFS